MIKGSFDKEARYSRKDISAYTLEQTPAPRKKRERPYGRSLCCSYILAVLAHLGEAIAAVNRTIALGLKRHAGLATAGSAGSGEELTGATGGVLASITAGLAALGLVLETALGVELLLTGGENELVTALLAS